LADKGEVILYFDFPNAVDNSIYEKIREFEDRTSWRVFIFDKVNLNAAEQLIRGLLPDADIKKIPYRVHGYFQNRKGFFAATHNRVVPLEIFGEHNMQNLSAAFEACKAAGITEDEFYGAISSFTGTSKRLQKIAENEKGLVYLDFAHSPSKVKATVEAVKARYPERNVIACLELHTYSSLSRDFLPLYKGSLENVSAAFVYFNPHAVEIKKLDNLDKETVRKSFNSDIQVFDNSSELFSKIRELNFSDPVFLFMSSGDFDGHDLRSVINQI
jgi:UDP-N-acetylmuramate: L-alanyl-gamma-D-glutamyl-meso-diaminopimelate ligase